MESREVVNIMLEWISNNKEWVFSGVGLFIISTLVALFKKQKNDKQIQKVRDNSTAIQVGGDFKVGDTDGKK